MNPVRVHLFFSVTLLASRLILLAGMGLCQWDEKFSEVSTKSYHPRKNKVSTESLSTTRLNLDLRNSTTQLQQTMEGFTSTARETTYTTQACENNNLTFFSADCSELCTCYENRVSCNSSYGCSSNATCIVTSDGTGECTCNVGFTGDGLTCSILYKDCYEAYQDGYTQNGVYTILPSGWPGTPFNVSCDMSTSGGGWLVFQRRIDNEIDFYRDWESYKYGFGSLEHGREFWLGNEKLFYVTNQTEYKLRVDIVTSSGSPKYQEYTRFRIGNGDTQYQLTDLGETSGTAGDGLSESIGSAFSTYDRDNDGCGLFNCAEEHRGAWWYTDKWCVSCWNSQKYCDNFETGTKCYNLCAFSNMNGLYNGESGKNINWNVARACHIKSTEMKIRPSSS